MGETPQGTGTQQPLTTEDPVPNDTAPADDGALQAEQATDDPTPNGSPPPAQPQGHYYP